MLRHRHACDLAVLDHDLHLHRLEALHLVHAARRARRGNRLRARTGRRSGLRQRVVDRVARQRHARHHVELRRRDVLSDQAVKARRDHIRTVTRRLVVLRYLKTRDLSILDGDLHLHRLEARHFVYVASPRLFGLGHEILIVEVDRLSNRLEDRVGRDRRARHHIDAFHITFHRRRVAVELAAEGRIRRLSAVVRGLVVGRHDDLGDHAVRRDAHAQADLVGKALRRELKDIAHRIVADRTRVDGLNRLIIAQQTHHVQRLKGLGCIDKFLAHEIVALKRGNRRIGHDAQHVLRVRRHLANCRDERLRADRRAGDRLHVCVDLRRVGGQTGELARKRLLADLRAQTGGLLQIAHGDAVDRAIRADAQRNRDRSAVSLRRRGHHIADDLVARLAHVQLRDLVVLGRSLDFLRLKDLRLGQHRALRGLAGGQLLLRNRAGRDLVGDGQRQRGNQGKDEQSEAELRHITHGSLPPQRTSASSRARSAARQRS